VSCPRNNKRGLKQSCIYCVGGSWSATDGQPTGNRRSPIWFWGGHWAGVHVSGQQWECRSPTCLAFYISSKIIKCILNNNTNSYNGRCHTSVFHFGSPFRDKFQYWGQLSILPDNSIRIRSRCCQMWLVVSYSRGRISEIRLWTAAIDQSLANILTQERRRKAIEFCPEHNICIDHHDARFPDPCLLLERPYRHLFVLSNMHDAPVLCLDGGKCHRAWTSHYPSWRWGILVHLSSSRILSDSCPTVAGILPLSGVCMLLERLAGVSESQYGQFDTLSPECYAGQSNSIG
jgi:hypothetical protein